MIGEGVVYHKDSIVCKLDRNPEYDEKLYLFEHIGAHQKSAENYTRGCFWFKNAIYGIKTEKSNKLEISKYLIKDNDKKNYKRNCRDLKNLSKEIIKILKQISQERGYNELKLVGSSPVPHKIVFDSIERELLEIELALLEKRLGELYLNDKIIIIDSLSNKKKVLQKILENFNSPQHI